MPGGVLTGDRGHSLVDFVSRSKCQNHVNSLFKHCLKLILFNTYLFFLCNQALPIGKFYRKAVRVCGSMLKTDWCKCMNKMVGTKSCKLEISQHVLNWYWIKIRWNRNFTPNIDIIKQNINNRQISSKVAIFLIVRRVS